MVTFPIETLSFFFTTLVVLQLNYKSLTFPGLSLYALFASYLVDNIDPKNHCSLNHCHCRSLEFTLLSGDPWHAFFFFFGFLAKRTPCLGNVLPSIST